MAPRRSDRTRFTLLLALLAVSACGTAETAALPQQSAAQEIAFPDTWRYSADTEPITAPNGMVSTTDTLATRVGLQVLEDGGTAVDAAIAVSFALAVVQPQAGNIGGGGFMVTRTAEGETFALDYRERAPLAAHADMYLDDDGEPTDASYLGHQAVGVPGSVMGMWEAHERFGTLEWARLVQPAVELAEGFPMSEEVAGVIRGQRANLEGFSATREIFLPGGAPPAAGQTFRQPDLARTLTRIRDQGTAGFYAGETADLIVEEMERGGGLITHEDLATYEAAWREPITFTYRDHTIHSMPPASSGGATLAMMARMVEAYDLAEMGWHSTDMIHVLIEAWKRAYADRNHLLADSDFVDVPLERMISREYARERGADISLASATPSERIEPGMESPVSEPTETTHVSIVDRYGNAVALTTTLNLFFGSKVTVEGAGIVLNNEMDDFTARPGFPNQYGLVQGAQNVIEPGKRMLSAMTPTIVEDVDGELFFLTGSPGGGTIITTVFQTIVNVVDFGMNAAQAVNAPRVHHQHLPDHVNWENGGLRPEVVRELEARGHVLQERGGISGDVQAILVLPDGTLSAYADQRRAGLALGH